MDYKIIKGILYRDGKKEYPLGQSYYPSFNPTKFPVPPEGDRMGEMKKDIQMMAEMGFNHIRFAALGEVKLEGDTLCVDTPFIDAMIREAEKNGVSVSIREQGFAVNLRNHPDADLLDWNGNHPTYRWADFIRTRLFHEGILEDNRIYAKGLAEHYAAFPNVIAYQIYNEPHYPVYDMFDYNEDTIEEYRRWLVEKKAMTAEEAKDYQPPKSRKEQSPRMWALWRLFSRDGITRFLNNAAKASFDAMPLPTYTCFTVAAVTKRNAYHGCDLFANGRSMQIVGYTTYVHAFGANDAMLGLQADTAQCAAELGGTESWCIELDSRTYIPPSVYTRGVYTVLGSGCKGIVFYQWRGDCPVPGVPYPNSCGLLNYDGTKTANFENGAKVNRFIQRHNDLLMNAKRAHEGVGMLHSDYASFMCDAMENGDKTKSDEVYYNRHLSLYAKTYRELRETGISVSLVDEQGLRGNSFGIKVLLLPSLDLLSPEEQQAVQEFRQKGGKVYFMEGTEQGTGEFGYRELEDQKRGYVESVFWPIHTPRDVLDVEGICPKVNSWEPRVSVRLLEGEDYALVVLTNTAVKVQETDVRLTVQLPFTTATFSDIDGEKEVLVEGNVLTIKNVTDGGILILK